MAKKFWAEKKLGVKKFWVKKIEIKKFYELKKVVVLIKICGLKSLGFYKFWCWKRFWAKKKN